ncbi:MAG: arginine--tRNA ligase [Defluviitaleaceae bacterium]|nr:arginine--tRNA ligase [Defluviitaleaceae bacterium]
MNYTKALAEALAPLIELTAEEILPSIEAPPDARLGHFAYPCFRLAKTLKKAPPMIAAEVAGKIMEARPAWLRDAKATGPYINFFLDHAAFAGDVLKDVLSSRENFGAKGQGAGKNVVMDYSSPNVAKHFHVGHLGSTVIGKAIDNIYSFLGYNVTSINHLGDWGTQFGKLIVAYKKWGNHEEIEKTEIEGLTKIYVRFHEEADKDPSLNDEARAWVVKMQNGDEEGLRLWKWFVDLSLREYNRLYEKMGINFDLFRGESYYNNMLDGVAAEIDQKGLLEESDGAKVVFLEDHGMPPCLILRSDGGTLYPTRDIAAAINRHQEFKFDLCLYVTGQEQKLHFAQWMKVVELMGYPWAGGLVHIPYGMYRFEDGAMSTRRGQVIKMEDLINEAVAKTRNIIEERNPSLPNKEEVAWQVGYGALVFNKLYNSRIKDTVFSWEHMLNFEGETGPYVQYTHARACSVLEKGGWGGNVDFDPSLVAEDEAFDVLRLIYDFPGKVEESAAKYEPFIIARQLVAIAQAFNVYYSKNMILVDDAKTRQARLALTCAVRQILKNGLQLLGIAAPVAM